MREIERLKKVIELLQVEQAALSPASVLSDVLAVFKDTGEQLARN